MSVMKTYFFFLLTILFATPLLAQKHLYVSVEGSDKNNGSRNKPFRTIEKAQQIVWDLKEDTREDITVHISSGVYLLSQPLKFNHKDGAGSGQRVTYSGDKSGETIISGGKMVKNWTKSARAGLYEAKIPQASFRQLYVNGSRAVRARFPNKGEFLRSNGWDFDKRQIKIPGNYSKHNGAGSPMEMMLIQWWSEGYLRIKNIETTSLKDSVYSLVTFKDAEADILFNRPYPFKAQTHSLYFENSIDLLDQDKEWFYDAETSILYYKPADHEDMNTAEVIYPVLDTLLMVEGKAEQPVTGLTFEHISFRHSNWTYPTKNGYLNAQAGQFNISSTPDNQQFIRRPPAAFYVAYAQNLSVFRCSFTQLGATGVDFHYGTESCEIIGNKFFDVAGNGISIGKFTTDEATEMHELYNPADKREICRNDVISNNVITNVAADYYGCVGIAAGYPANLTISHNIVSDLPYTGISLGYGWQAKPNAMENNTISYNEVRQVMKLLKDGGGIYTLSYQPGLKIYRNYLHDIQSENGHKDHIYGLYMDEKSGGSEASPAVVEENIIAYSIPDRINFHQPGVILIKNTIHNSKQTNGEEIMSRVGLEAAFRDLLEK